MKDAEKSMFLERIKTLREEIDELEAMIKASRTTSDCMLQTKTCWLTVILSVTDLHRE